MSATERTLLAFAIEDAAGVAATDGATNNFTSDGASIAPSKHIVIYDYNPIQGDIEAIRLTPATGDLGPGDFIPGRTLYNLNFTVQLFGSGIVATPPHYLDLLRTCGFRRFTLIGTGPTAATYAASAGGVLPAGVYQYATATVTDRVAGITGVPGTHWLLSKLVLATGTPITTTVTAGQKVTLSFGAAGAGKRTWIFRSDMHATAPVAPYYFVGEANATATSFVDECVYDTQKGVEYPGGATPLTDAGAAAFGTVYFPGSDVAEAQAAGVAPPLESASVAVWLDGLVHIGLGMRGSISQMTANAGGVMSLNIQSKVLYADPVAATNPAFQCRSTPPKFESAGAFIQVENSASLTRMLARYPPILKTVTFTSGTQLTERRNANAANAVTEIGIVRKFDPRVGMNFEMAPASIIPLRDMKNGYYSRAGWQIGPSATNRVIFRAAQMRYQAAPPYNDSEGYRGHDASWVPGAGGGNMWCSFLVE